MRILPLFLSSKVGLSETNCKSTKIFNRVNSSVIVKYRKAPIYFSFSPKNLDVWLFFFCFADIFVFNKYEDKKDI